MRIRSIKPEFWRSDDINELDTVDRLLFIGLWSYVDDNGVGRDKLADITADLFAGDLERDPRETFARVSRGLQNLSEAGRIVRYTVENRPLLYVTNWDKHQRIDKPNKERFPLPTRGDAVIRDILATSSRESRESLAPGTEEQGSRGTEEQGSSNSPSGELAPTPSPPVQMASASRARAITPDWQPDPEVNAAMRNECPNVDLDAEHRKFVDWWTGTGKPMKDWNAVWRNWIRRTAETGARNSRPRAGTDIDWDAAAARAAERDRNSA